MLISDYGKGYISISLPDPETKLRATTVYGQITQPVSSIIYRPQYNNLTVCAGHNKETGELQLLDSFMNVKLNLHKACLLFSVDNQVPFKSLRESICSIVAEIPLLKNTLTMNAEVALEQFDELFFVDANKINIPELEKEFPEKDFMGCVPARYKLSTSEITLAPEIFFGLTWKSKKDNFWKETNVSSEVARKLIKEFPQKTIGMIVDSNFISEGKPMYHKYNYQRNPIWGNETLPQNVYLIYYSSKDNFKENQISKDAQKIRKELPFYKGFKQYDIQSRNLFNAEHKKFTLEYCKGLYQNGI